MEWEWVLWLALLVMYAFSIYIDFCNASDIGHTPVKRMKVNTRMNHAKAICLYHDQQDVRQIHAIRDLGDPTPIYFFSRCDPPKSLPEGVHWTKLDYSPQSVWDMVLQVPARCVTWIQLNVLLLSAPVVPSDEANHFYWQPELKRAFAKTALSTAQYPRVRMDCFTINRVISDQAIQTLLWTFEQSYNLLSDAEAAQIAWSSTKTPVTWHYGHVVQPGNYYAVLDETKAILGSIYPEPSALEQRPTPEITKYEVHVSKYLDDPLLITTEGVRPPIELIRHLEPDHKLI